MATPPDDAVLQTHYAQGVENGRLTSGVGLFEFERTKELLLRYLPSPPAAVADIGGGPGAYALWLASLGHRVEHRDLSSSTSSSSDRGSRRTPSSRLP